MNNYYQKLNINIDMGSKYLINETAYFLGGIFAANESVIYKGEKYWIAPVRYNHSYVTPEELEQHFFYVRKSAKKLNQNTLMANTIKSNGLDSGKFSRLLGFGTFFRATSNESLNDLIYQIKDSLLNSPDEIKRSFIIGMFDGRGSIDRNSNTLGIRYVVLDCEDAEIGEFLCEVLSSYNLNHNYNTARNRLEGGDPRKNQIRIPGGERFMERVGFISERRFNIGKQSYNNIINGYTVLQEDNILSGLKSISINEG